MVSRALGREGWPWLGKQDSCRDSGRVGVSEGLSPSQCLHQEVISLHCRIQDAGHKSTSRAVQLCAVGVAGCTVWCPRGSEGRGGGTESQHESPVCLHARGAGKGVSSKVLFLICTPNSWFRLFELLWPCTLTGSILLRLWTALSVELGAARLLRLGLWAE